MRPNAIDAEFLHCIRSAHIDWWFASSSTSTRPQHDKKWYGSVLARTTAFQGKPLKVAIKAWNKKDSSYKKKVKTICATRGNPNTVSKPFSP